MRTWIRWWRRGQRRSNAEQSLMRFNREIRLLDRLTLIALVSGETDKAKEHLARADKLIRNTWRLQRVLYPRYFSR